MGVAGASIGDAGVVDSGSIADTASLAISLTIGVAVITEGFSLTVPTMATWGASAIAALVIVGRVICATPGAVSEPARGRRTSSVPAPGSS